MTNGELIRTLDDEGIANLMLCVKCWVRSKNACISRYDCPKWREFVEWLGEDVEMITLTRKQNEK